MAEIIENQLQLPQLRSYDEKQALLELKSVLSDNDNPDYSCSSMDDMTLLRFLRARDLSVKKAQEMIIRSIEWRKTYKVESILSSWDAPSEISRGFIVYKCGHDYEGRPVFYAPLGHWTSARVLYDAGRQEDIMTYAVKTMELIYLEAKRCSKHQNFVTIVDVSPIPGQNQFTNALYEVQNLKGIQDLVWLFREYEANCPETLHRAFVVNTPSVFHWGFNIVKPLMSNHTLSKITIFDSRNNAWQTELRKAVPQNAIPKDLGGTSELTTFY